MGEAHLITPEGKIITLYAADYTKVITLLSIKVDDEGRPDAGEIRALVRELSGKYAGGSSLAQALLAERAREREQAKPCRHA